jgi:hypothetical protein
MDREEAPLAALATRCLAATDSIRENAELPRAIIV